MKGYVREVDKEESRGTRGTLPPWEALAVDAVGAVIDFWSFKRNQGRMWALLYLRGQAMSALELQEALGLSKGAVSILVRELEQWGVVRRVRGASADVWRYAAETDLMKMVRRVISERELALVRSVLEDLDEALTLARKTGALAESVARLRRMRTLATVVDKALSAFLRTARLDVVGALDVLANEKEEER